MEQGLRSGCPLYNLSVSLSLDTSPSRGGLGIPVQFVRLGTHLLISQLRRPLLDPRINAFTYRIKLAVHL